MPDFNLSTVVCALCALAFLCGLLYREALPELEA